MQYLLISRFCYKDGAKTFRKLWFSKLNGKNEIEIFRITYQINREFTYLMKFCIT